jgi:hypothetical protein
MFRSSNRINCDSEEREYWYNKRRDYEEENEIEEGRYKWYNKKRHDYEEENEIEEGRYESSSEISTEIVPSMTQPPVVSKLEWFSKATSRDPLTSMETDVKRSREAHITKEGIRQTRASNIEPLIKKHTIACTCAICFINWEGDPKLNPHTSSCNILFKDMTSWIESLPKNGTVRVTTVSEFDT